MSKARNGLSGAAGDALSSISKGTVIEGTVRSQSDIRIDGEVRGDVKVEGRVALGEHGKIDGTMESNDALIEGRIDGDVIVRGRLELKAKSHVEGNIQTAKLVVTEGATFTGRCDMTGVTKPGGSKSGNTAKQEQPKLPA